MNNRRKMSVAARALIFVFPILCTLFIFPGSHGILKGEDTKPSFYLRCDGTFSSKDKKISYYISGTNVDKAEMKLVRVDAIDVMPTATMEQKSDEVIKSDDISKKYKSAKVVKEWTLKIADKRSSDWVSANDNFDNPGPGFYFLYGKVDDIENVGAFYVSDIAIISKRDESKSLFLVVDRATGAPISGASIYAFKDGKQVMEDKTDAQGLAVYKNPIAGENKTPILAVWKEHIAILDLSYSWYSAHVAGYTFYTVTDRPVYRPDHVVNFKTTVRKSDGNIYSLPDADKADVEIKDPKGNSVYKETLPLNKFGSCKGSFTLGDEPAIGSYSIVTTVNGENGYLSFMVEEYRKPEYEVTVTPDVSVTIQGNDIAFTVNAKYYFGEPVKNTDVQYSVIRSDHRSWIYRGPYSWYFDEDRYFYNYGEETVLSGTGKTDAKGVLQIKVPAQKKDNDSTYTLTATVTDKSRRQVTGSGSAIAARAEFNVFLSTDRFSYRPADKVAITATTRDYNGNTVGGKSVDLKIVKVEWNIKKDYERIEQVVLNRKLETGPDGTVSYDFTPDMTGYFEVTATATDSKKNTVTDFASFYVTSPDDTGSYWSSGGLKVIMDKSSYAVGDTARALITSNTPGVSALVAVEADSIYEYTVLSMPQGSALYEFKVTDRMQPNAYVSVALIYQNNFNNISEPIVVPPTDKFLDVQIQPDKKEYRPGDKADFVVNVKDSNGRAAGNVELSLGVVDESIYALQPENAQDTRQFFFGKRGDSVQTSSSLWFHGGNTYAKGMMVEDAMPMAAPAPGATAKKKDGGSEYAEAKIRSDFRDTAYWEAQLTTDADGTARASFNMPDSLTTWRATARAISADTKVGNNTGQTIVRKNLIVRLETPRFFTQGDIQNITAVVHNYLSSEKNVKCQLHVKGIKLDNADDKMIKVPAGGDARVEWHGTVESPQTAWVTVKALTDEESDAMQLDVPVLPHGMKKTTAVAGEVEKSAATEKIKIPAGAIKGATTLRVSLSPSIAAAMFESLDYLVGYPYGCVEQTMSRFLPDIVVQQAMQRLGLKQDEKFKELPKMVGEGLQRLANFQHGDGGWGWWEHDDTHPYMTAYVIYGLTQAQKADYAVNKDMLDHGVTALKNLIAKEKDLDTLSYMMFALDAAGQKDDALLKKLYSNYSKLNPYSQSLIAMSLESNGRHDDALKVIRGLEKQAKTSATSARWEGKSFHYSWMDNTVETTSFILKAFLKVDPDNKLIPLIVRYLATSRNGDHWYSTKDTAAAILALTDFVTAKENLKPDFSLSVKLNGKEILNRHFTSADIFLPAVVLPISDLDGALKSGDNTLEIVKLSGTGKIYYTAALEYFASEQQIKAANNGIDVSRYYSFDAAGKKKVKQSALLKSGTEIYVHITLKPGSGCEYAILEDMLPSGFEVVKEEYDYPYYFGGWDWWYPNKEIRDDKVVFFATSMSQKSYELNYRIRAEVPGSVSALPARAWLMYFPEIGGNSSEFKFKVSEK